MGEAESCVMTALPLAGIKVISLEAYGAGPYCTMFLAQLGAEVIKIEPINGGDTARATGPYFLGENDSLFFQTFNYNKKSLTLDMKSTVGRTIFEALVKKSDAVVNNMRGDQSEALKLTYAHLKHINPKIVCGHLSAYGRGTAREAWPGYDYLMQAEAGFMALTGEPDGDPQRFGLSMVDFMTGSQFATGITAALFGALRTGIGMDVDVSLLDAALHQLSYPAMWYLNAGHIVERTARSSHPYVVPSQMFRTKDGWIFIMAQLPKFYTTLVTLLQAPHLTEDARFSDVAARFHNKTALVEALETILQTQPTAHWIDLLGGEVPVAPVYDIPQALNNPHMHTNGMVRTVPHPNNENMRALANPLKINGERLNQYAAPALGADTNAILNELGYSAADITELRAQKII
jgi:crotonobetainyl-CoA:carnitine CoA-transferase CaiB-like acyl-CoA transferase